MNSKIKNESLQNSPITEPIEIRWNKWHIYGRLSLGILFFIVGSIFGYILFVLDKMNGDTMKNVQKALIPLVLYAIGYFGAIPFVVKRLRMTKPRMILYPEKLECYNFNDKAITIFWKDIRRISYRWYDDGTIASSFTITLEVMNIHGQVENIELDVKALKPNKDWIFKKISNQLNLR